MWRVEIVAFRVVFGRLVSPKRRCIWRKHTVKGLFNHQQSSAFDEPHGSPGYPFVFVLRLLQLPQQVPQRRAHRIATVQPVGRQHSPGNREQTPFLGRNAALHARGAGGEVGQVQGKGAGQFMVGANCLEAGQARDGKARPAFELGDELLKPGANPGQLAGSF